MSDIHQQADVVIIGAGITAIGIARGLAKKGLASVLVDPGEPASLTSDNSLRIIHGGIRYLQQLDFKRSLKSIKAQQQLMNEYPELIRTLSCLMPLRSFGLKSYLPMLVAKFIYSYLLEKAGSVINHPRLLSAKNIPASISKVHKNKSRHYFNWFDAQVVNCLALATAELAKIREETAFVQDLVISVSKESEDYYLTNLARGPKIKSSAVINAAAMGGTSIEFNKIKTAHCQHWAQAFNLVFNICPKFQEAITIRSSEGREYFVVPRGVVSDQEDRQELAIGTFYYPVEQKVRDMDIAELIISISQLAPELELTLDNFKYLESGELPCKEEFRSEGSILKNDIIHQDQKYWQVYTPKYTTYQVFGEVVADQVAKEFADTTK